MRFRPHHAWRGVHLTLTALVLTTALAGCITDDDNSATPTPTAAPTLTGATGQETTDGICKATVPINWAERGTGRGTTAEGGSYTLFGGKIADDEAWKQAVQLVLAQAANQPDAKITQEDDFVRIQYPNDTALDYRARFNVLYCDFKLTAGSRSLADDEKAGFEAAVASLGPASTTD